MRGTVLNGREFGQSVKHSQTTQFKNPVADPVADPEGVCPPIFSQYKKGGNFRPSHLCHYGKLFPGTQKLRSDQNTNPIVTKRPKKKTQRAAIRCTSRITQNSHTKTQIKTYTFTHGENHPQICSWPVARENEWLLHPCRALRVPIPHAFDMPALQPCLRDRIATKHQWLGTTCSSYPTEKKIVFWRAFYKVYDSCAEPA